MTSRINQLAIDLEDLTKHLAKGTFTQAEYDDQRAMLLKGNQRDDEENGEGFQMLKMIQKKDAEEHFKWKINHRKFLLATKNWDGLAIDAKKKEFFELAEANQISPMERMLSTYTVFGNSADLRFFHNILIRTPDHKRVSYHNWYVAGQMGEQFLEDYGDLLDSGTLPPLYPPDEMFGTLNRVILRAHDPTLVGAGPVQTSLFNQPDQVLFAGGYAIPVENGFVDIGIVEEAVGWLDTRVVDLETALKTAKVEPPPRKTQYAKPYPPQQRNAYHYYNSGYQGGYQGGYGGRRGGRGRGGRGRGYQGNW